LEILMRALTWDDFADGTGSVYVVAVGEEQVELTLDQAKEIASAGRAGGSFRLEFLGPSDPVLPQACYPVRFGDEMIDIFMVPVSADRTGARYEAIFY
jgi:hypothetical protein